jgi:hypothetical protein
MSAIGAGGLRRANPMFLMAAPAVWAQFRRADMMKLATDRFERCALRQLHTHIVVPGFEPAVTNAGEY